MDGERERRCARRAGPARWLTRARDHRGQGVLEYVGVLVLVAAIIASVAALDVPVTAAHAVSCEVKQITAGGCSHGPAPLSAGSALGAASPLGRTGGGQPTERQMERILGSNRLIAACAGSGQTEIGADQAPASQACKAQLAKLSPRALSVLELMAALFQAEHDWRPGFGSKEQYFQTLLALYVQNPGAAVIALSRTAQALQSGPILASQKIESNRGDIFDGMLGSLCGGYGICLGGTTLSQAYQQAYHSSAAIAKITTPVLVATGVAGALKDIFGAGAKAVLARLGASERTRLEQAVEDLEKEAENGQGGAGGAGGQPPDEGGGQPPNEGGGGAPPPPGSGPGDWTFKNESMSDRARSYQDQITGQRNAAGSFVYKASGGGATADFDGYRDGKLIEAKGPGYANFTKDGEFQPWWANSKSGGQQMLGEARRQATVGKALGVPVEWDVAEPQAEQAIKRLLRSNGVTGITVRYVPPQP